MHPLKSVCRLADKIKNCFLDIIFPRYCFGCNKEGSYFCFDCFSSVPLQKSIVCFVCGRRSPTGSVCKKCRQKNNFLNGLIVASDWENMLLRKIIYGYKYHFVKELSEPLSRIMINFLENIKPANWQIDQLILVPVPLHPRRALWRGFNQAEILAEKIGDHFNLPTAADILIRCRHTLPQMNINDQIERRKNIKNAFMLSEKNFIYLENKIVLLVDDVCTTGSTLEECAETLKPLKPKEIWGLVIARG